MTIKCLAIDDEPYALKQIGDYIRKTPFLELAGGCSNAFEAMEVMSSKEVDLFFIDDGFEELRTDTVAVITADCQELIILIDCVIL